MLDEIFSVADWVGFCVRQRARDKQCYTVKSASPGSQELLKDYFIWLFYKCGSVFLLNSSIKQPCDQKRN